MVVQRYDGAPGQVEGLYTQDVIRSFVNELTVPDVNGFESVRLTLKPNDPEMDRLLEIYAHHFPKMWNESWTPSETDARRPTDVVNFGEDIAREADRVVEYWDEHRRDHRDILTVAGQKRFAEASKAFGCGFLIYMDKFVNPKVIQDCLSKAFIALAEECNEGRLGGDGIMELSMTQYPEVPTSNRVKINTNQPASPELYDGIKKILTDAGLNMRIKVKTSIATYITKWARETGRPHFPFDSPATTYSSSVDDLNNLLAKTSFLS
ncbi:unnamed protein product, partial [Mesorhabditis spiculigera]